MVGELPGVPQQQNYHAGSQFSSPGCKYHIVWIPKRRRQLCDGGSLLEYRKKYRGKTELRNKGRIRRKAASELSTRMTADFGKGFTVTNLQNMRLFYLNFQNSYALRTELSWTHYRLLMRIESEQARQFYLDECVKSAWSTRQLERQINSFFYERLLSSQNKGEVGTEIQSLAPAKTPEDVIRDPYVLEFLGLEPSASFFESDLEQALIEHLQKFLLELGRGFSFVARQKRFTFDGRHFYIDIVFYNYLLKCFVLIDLKLGDLTHQDLWQMQMYVNYYTREVMNDGDNPTIGIILCADKSDTVVKYTLPDIAVRLRGNKKVQNLNEMWYKEVAQHLATQGDFGLESP
jgi:predicted nuclease of restriction endonuclease-like (RecB) superfamily